MILKSVCLKSINKNKNSYMRLQVSFTLICRTVMWLLVISAVRGAVLWPSIATRHLSLSMASIRLWATSNRSIPGLRFLFAKRILDCKYFTIVVRPKNLHAEMRSNEDAESKKVAGHLRHILIVSHLRLQPYDKADFSVIISHGAYLSAVPERWSILTVIFDNYCLFSTLFNGNLKLV